MLETFFLILPFFILILLGGVFGYFNKNFSKTTVSELNRFVYFVGFPCYILNSFLSIEMIPAKAINISLINVIILIGFIFLMVIVMRNISKSTSLQNTYMICAFFGNIAYLGFPLLYALNENNSILASLHVAGYLVVLFTIGIIYLEISKNKGRLNYGALLKSIVLNPLLIATFFSLIITIFQIRLPVIGIKVISMMAASATPVILFALGIFIIQNKLVKSTLFHAINISMIKLLVLPAIFWLIATLLFPNDNFEVPIIMAAMPVAILPFILADVYKMDKEIIASAIVISTIMSIVIIPLIVNLV